MKSPSPIRWVGSKARFLNVKQTKSGERLFDLLDYLPATCNNYFESFCGGGAVFFEYGHKCTGRAYLNDINAHLMNTFECLGQYREEVLFELNLLKNATYEFIKQRFNTHKGEIEIRNWWDEQERCEMAALFIALNHLNFNGVYRENKKGQYNVPIGKDSKGIARCLDTLNLDKLVEAGEKLEKSQAFVTWGSFNPWPFDVRPQAGDVVVFDPPYIDEFSQYDKSGFTADDHKILNAQVFAAAASGATVLLCGSDNAVSREIYGEPTKVVELSRTVGHSKRGKATEAFWLFNTVR